MSKKKVKKISETESTIYDSPRPDKRVLQSRESDIFHIFNYQMWASQ